MCSEKQHPPIGDRDKDLIRPDGLSECHSDAAWVGSHYHRFSSVVSGWRSVVVS